MIILCSSASDFWVDLVELLGHSREDLALNFHVRCQREGILGLEVLQHYVRLGFHQILSQNCTCLLEIDAVKLMVVERRLEATKAFEDCQELLC